MRRTLAIGIVLAAGAAVGGWMSGQTGAAAAGEAMIGHMVYFKLTDPAGAAKLVAACDKHLKGHPGEVFYAAGTLVKDLNRPVNDQDWDVALHLVFRSRADHDKYQDAPRHTQFIEENKAGWAKVRVFDSLLAAK